VQIIAKKSANNTRFRNIQTREGRIQYLFQRAENLTAEDIPFQWRSSHIVHLGPVAGEVDPEILQLFPNSMICLTPQGWMRTWDSQGKIYYQTWEDSDKILKQANVACLSLEDVQNDEDIIEDMALNIPVLAVTEGQHGARVYWNGDVRHFKTQEAEEVDVTGAGDIFAAAFFFRYYSTRDPWESARFANNIASTSVQRKGIDSIPRAVEIEKYKQEIIQNQ
jgi:sugar/nucleoside kinase (ribokinase family)